MEACELGLNPGNGPFEATNFWGPGFEPIFQTRKMKVGAANGLSPATWFLSLGEVQPFACQDLRACPTPKGDMGTVHPEGCQVTEGRQP